MATAACAAAPIAGRHCAPSPHAPNRTCAGASTSYATSHALLRAPSARPRQQPQRRRRGGDVLVRAGGGEIVEVKDLRGIRVMKNEDDTPRVEYLVQWKDGSPDTWEVATNLADNLLRDYEQRWWGAVKKGDEETIREMMKVGGDVLARTVNEDRRSALHFVAAMGKAPLTEALIRAGAEVDLADKEGYTPLHMAAGYMHTTTIGALLAGGADPEQADRKGRSPLELVESLREALPAGNPMLVQRRMALEDVIQMLMANMFEDVEPVAVLGRRERVPEPEPAAEGEEGGDKQAAGAEEAGKEEAGEEKEAGKEEEAAAAGPPVTEWLVQFATDEEPVWVDARYVSQEVADDYEAGLEYAQAECVLDMRQRGTMRKYLVRWQDDYPDTWEPEEHVSRDLVELWERKRGLFVASSDNSDSEPEGRGSGNGSGGAAAAAGVQQLQGSPA